MPRKPKIEVHTGFKINHLTLVEMLPKREYYRPDGSLRGTNLMARWRCDCGKEFNSKISHVTHQATKSCGCFAHKSAGDRMRIHGLDATRIYRVHQNMKNRCHNPRVPSYKWYGARGVVVCERWRGEGGFLNFLSDMGPVPSLKHTLERKDSNGNYEPSNCIWLIESEQNKNKRSTVRMTLDGVPLCQREFSILLGVNDGQIATYRKRGLTAEQIRDHFDKVRSRSFRTIYEKQVI